MPDSVVLSAEHVAHSIGRWSANTSIADITDAWPGAAEIWSTLTLRAGFNTNTVIAGTTLLGLAAGIIGVFALLRKRSLMSDALSHATLPGIAIAFLTATALGVEGRSLPLLLFGGAVSGVLGVLAIQAMLRYTRLHEDAAIGIVLSVFFGAGIVALSYIQKNAPDNAAGLSQFIYGQTAAMQVKDAVLMGGIAVIAMISTVALFKEFSLVCFNDAFARVDGWSITLIDLLMMALVVLVTVSGLQAVGLILVVAMLIIPPVSARFWTDRLWVLLTLSGVIGGLSGYFGSVVSALLPRKPAGSVIVLTSSVLFVISMVVAPARGMLATAIRQFRLRLRIAGEHILEAAYAKHAIGQGQAALSRDEVAQLAKTRGWSAWFEPLVILSLRHRKQIVESNGMVELTSEGQLRGAQVCRNHQLWEQYLISYADVAPNHVDWSVDQVEHVLSADLVSELESALERRGITIPERAAASEMKT